MPSPVKITKRRQATVKGTDVRSAGVAPTFNLLGSRTAADGSTWDDHYKRAQAALDPTIGAWDAAYEQAQAKLAQVVEGPELEAIARAVMDDPELQKQLAKSGLTTDQYVKQLAQDPKQLAKLVAEQRAPGWQELYRGLASGAPAVDRQATNRDLASGPTWTAAETAGRGLLNSGFNRLGGGALLAPLIPGLVNPPTAQVDRPAVARWAPVFEAGQRLKLLEKQYAGAAPEQKAQLADQLTTQRAQLEQLQQQAEGPQPEPSYFDKAKDLGGALSDRFSDLLLPSGAHANIGAMQAWRGPHDAQSQTENALRTGGKSLGALRSWPAMAEAFGDGGTKLLNLPRATTLGRLAAGTAEAGSAALGGLSRLPQVLAAGGRALPAASVVAAAPGTLYHGIRRSAFGSPEGQDEVTHEAADIDEKIRRGGILETPYQGVRALGNLLLRQDPLAAQGLVAQQLWNTSGATGDFDAHHHNLEQADRFENYEREARAGIGQLLPGITPGQEYDLARAATARRWGVDERWDAPNTQREVQALPTALQWMQEQGHLGAPLSPQQTARLEQVVKTTGLMPALKTLFYDRQTDQPLDKPSFERALTALSSTDAPLTPPQLAYTQGPRWQTGAQFVPPKTTPGHVAPAPASTAPTREQLAYRQAVADQQTKREEGIAQRTTDVRAQSKALWDNLRTKYGPDVGTGAVDRGIPWAGMPHDARESIAKPFTFTPQIAPKPDPQWAPPAWQVGMDHAAAVAAGRPWTPPYKNMAAWIKGGPQAAPAAVPTVAPPVSPTPPTAPVQPPVLAQNGVP